MSKRYGRKQHGRRGPGARRRPRRRTESREVGVEEREERLEVSRAIGAAYRGLRSLRALCIVDAVILGLLLLLVLGGDSLLAKAIFGGLFLAAVACSVFVVRYPLASTTTIALLHTPPAILAKVYLGFDNLLGFSLIGLCLLLWTTVTMARNTQKLVEEYPDVWASKAIRGEGRRAHEMDSKWRDRSRELKRKQIQQVILFGALPLALLIIGFAVFSGDDADSDRDQGNPFPLERPAESVHATIDRFEAAWNAAQHDEVKAFVADSEKPSRCGQFDRIVLRRKWQETLPRATRTRTERHNQSQYYSFHDLEGYGELQVWWEWERPKWVIVRWRFKKSSD